MMKHLRTGFLLGSLAVLALSCIGPVTEEDDRFHEDPVIAVPASISLNPPTVTLDYVAGVEDSTLVVTDQEKVEVLLNSDAEGWLSYTFENGKIKVLTKEENPASKPRTGLLTLVAGEGVSASSAEFSVVQSGSPKPVLTLSQESVSVGESEGDSAVLEITDTNLEEISVSTDASWCKAEISGLVITVTVLEANPATEKRSANLVIDGRRMVKKVPVIQDAKLPASLVGTAYGTEGVYFWRNPDNPYEYKVVSARAEKLAWGPATVAGCSGSKLSTEAACEKIRANGDYATADYGLKFCDALGEGWNMPNHDDAENLFEAYNSLRFDNKKGPATVDKPSSITDAERAARAAFEAVLASIGGVPMNSMSPTENGDSIWLCQEATTGVKAYYFRFGSPSYTTIEKSSTGRFVRCIKTVTVKK